MTRQASYSLSRQASKKGPLQPAFLGAMSSSAGHFDNFLGDMPTSSALREEEEAGGNGDSKKSNFANDSASPVATTLDYQPFNQGVNELVDSEKAEDAGAWLDIMGIPETFII